MIYRTKGEYIRERIQATDVVLDVGFVGQGIRVDNPASSHAILRSVAADVYGIDTQVYIPVDERLQGRYLLANAEQFSLGRLFDVIYAGDLIEHLSNPGLFLESCRAHLVPEGRLILTTPNCFNLFNLAEKLSKSEPTVNSDHTVYFNPKTLATLLRKNGFEIVDTAYIYSLEVNYRESLKKRFLNAIYWASSLFTEKFIETLCVTATAKKHLD